VAGELDKKIDEKGTREEKRGGKRGNYYRWTKRFS